MRGMQAKQFLSSDRVIGQKFWPITFDSKCPLLLLLYVHSVTQSVLEHTFRLAEKCHFSGYFYPFYDSASQSSRSILDWFIGAASWLSANKWEGKVTVGNAVGSITTPSIFYYEYIQKIQPLRAFWFLDKTAININIWKSHLQNVEVLINDTECNPWGIVDVHYSYSMPLHWFANPIQIPS